MHFREHDGYGLLKNTGGCTLAYTVSPELDGIFVQIAYCHSKDQFQKAVGRKVAKDRLHSDGPVDVVGFVTPVRETLRMWFQEFLGVTLVEFENIWMTDWVVNEYVSDDDNMQEALMGYIQSLNTPQPPVEVPPESL